jgi:nucleotide-binding universal stress UspA family protein
MAHGDLQPVRNQPSTENVDPFRAKLGRDGLMTRSERTPPHIVLVAVDDSNASERVVTFVNEFFASLDVQIVGMNVGTTAAAWMPTGLESGGAFVWPYVPNPPAPTEEDLELAVHDAAETVESSGLIDDEVVAEIGDPVTAITKVAIERGADLIVVGDRHKSGWRRLLEGSVTDEIRREAPCPVLVVP